MFLARVSTPCALAVASVAAAEASRWKRSNLVAHLDAGRFQSKTIVITVIRQMRMVLSFIGLKLMFLGVNKAQSSY